VYSYFLVRITTSFFLLVHKWFSSLHPILQWAVIVWKKNNFKQRHVAHNLLTKYILWRTAMLSWQSRQAVFTDKLCNASHSSTRSKTSLLLVPKVNVLKSCSKSHIYYFLFFLTIKWFNVCVVNVCRIHCKVSITNTLTIHKHLTHF